MRTFLDADGQRRGRSREDVRHVIRRRVAAEEHGLERRAAFEEVVAQLAAAARHAHARKRRAARERAVPERDDLRADVEVRQTRQPRKCVVGDHPDVRRDFVGGGNVTLEPHEDMSEHDFLETAYRCHVVPRRSRKGVRADCPDVFAARHRREVRAVLEGRFRDRRDGCRQVDRRERGAALERRGTDLFDVLGQFKRFERRASSERRRAESRGRSDAGRLKRRAARERRCADRRRAVGRECFKRRAASERRRADCCIAADGNGLQRRKLLERLGGDCGRTADGERLKCRAVLERSRGNCRAAADGGRRKRSASLKRACADVDCVLALDCQRGNRRLPLERIHADAGGVGGDDERGRQRTSEAGHDRAGPREAEGVAERTLEGVRRHRHAVFKPEHVVELRTVLERAVTDGDERIGQIERREVRGASKRAVRDHLHAVGHGRRRGNRSLPAHEHAADDDRAVRGGVPDAGVAERARAALGHVRAARHGGERRRALEEIRAERRHRRRNRERRREVARVALQHAVLDREHVRRRKLRPARVIRDSRCHRRRSRHLRPARLGGKPAGKRVARARRRRERSDRRAGRDLARGLGAGAAVCIERHRVLDLRPARVARDVRRHLRRSRHLRSARFGGVPAGERVARARRRRERADSLAGRDLARCRGAGTAVRVERHDELRDDRFPAALGVTTHSRREARRAVREVEVAARRVHELRINGDIAFAFRQRRRAGVRELHAVRRRLVVGRGSVRRGGVAPDDRMVSRRHAVHAASDQSGVAVNRAAVERRAVDDAGFAGGVAVDEAPRHVAESDGRAVAGRRVAVDLAVVDVRAVDRAAPALAARDDAVLQVDAVGRRTGIILVPAVAQGEADEGEVLRAVVVVHADIGAAAVDDRLRRASRRAERHGGRHPAAPHANRRVGARRDEHSFTSADPRFRLLEGLERRLGRSRAVRRAVDGVDVELAAHGDFPLGVHLSVGPERVGHFAHEQMAPAVCVGRGVGPARPGGRDKRIIEIPAVVQRRAFGVVRRHGKLLAVAREDEHLVLVWRDRVDHGTRVRIHRHGERKGLPGGVAVVGVRHERGDLIRARVVDDAREQSILGNREPAVVREAGDHDILHVGEVLALAEDFDSGLVRSVGVGDVAATLAAAVGEAHGVVRVERRGELGEVAVALALP